MTHSDEEMELAIDLVGDIWTSLEHTLKELDLDAEVKMRILQIFQQKSDVFGFRRRDLGLPEENADILFVRSAKKGGSG